MRSGIYRLNYHYDHLLRTSPDRAFLWFFLPLVAAAIIGVVGQLMGFFLFIMVLPVTLLLGFGFRLPYRLGWIDA